MSINIQTENNELKKIAGTHGTDNTSHVTIDSELSTESENPIQNKVITKELNDLGNTIGAIRLTKEYITEHNTLTSFISGLKENTCYIFYGAQAARSEMTILHNIGLIPKYGEGFLKILCSLNHYSINVEYNNTDRRLISYNPTVPGNYQLSDWYSLATTEGTVNHASNADNADTVDGYHVNDSATANPYGKIPLVKADGVMEVGKYIDFHASETETDNDVRIKADNGLLSILSQLAVGSDTLVNGRVVARNTNVSNSADIAMYVDSEGPTINFRSLQGRYYHMDTWNGTLRLYTVGTDNVLNNLFNTNGNVMNITGSAAKATRDGDGNNIAETYVKKSDLGSEIPVTGAYLPSIDGTTNYTKKTDKTKLVIGLGYGSITPVIMQGYGSIGLADNHGSVINGIMVETNQVTPRSFLEANSRPAAHGAVNLGSSVYPWDGVYSKTAVSITSDENMKNSITEVDLNTVEHLIENVLTYTYKLNDGESGRTHYGMIAQQLEEVLNKLGIDSKDFAAFIKSPVIEDIFGQAKDEEGNLLYDDSGEPIITKIGEKETGEYTHMIRYEELIPILWKNAQDKNKQIENLQSLYQNASDKIDALEQRIIKLEEYIKNNI